MLSVETCPIFSYTQAVSLSLDSSEMCSSCYLLYLDIPTVVIINNSVFIVFSYTVELEVTTLLDTILQYQQVNVNTNGNNSVIYR